MTLSSRPKRRQEERTAAFVEQAAAVDTEQLHCLIPADLHRRLRVLAAEDRTTDYEPGGCRRSRAILRHGRNSCSGVLMYTSPSVLQCARTVDIGSFRKTGWPTRAWWSRSSTTTTSLTNFNSLGVMRPENCGEIVSVYNLQFTMGSTNFPSRCCCCTRRGQPKPTSIGSGYPPLS